MPKDKPDSLWVVVLVASGVPVDMKAYRSWQAANRQARSWREDMRPDYDEVGFFEIEMGARLTCYPVMQ